MAERLTERNPEAQAGFFFTLQTLIRSAPHRTIVAIGVAAGFTHLLMTLAATGVRPREIQATPLGWFGIAIMMLAALLVGFRYAVTVPPEVRSNWTIRMAWLGDEREYLAGAKHAGLVALVALPLLVLLPLHVAMFGVVTAVVHSAYAVMFAAAAIDGLFISYRQFPFACSYVPVENPKLLWPVGLSSLLFVTYGFASIERSALQTATRTAELGAALVAIVVLVKAIDRARRRERRPLNFDERPAPATQRLGLFDRVAMHD